MNQQAQNFDPKARYQSKRQQKSAIKTQSEIVYVEDYLEYDNGYYS